jgi:3-methyl-2-oxobutanoate hydroxymethyltransferase
MIGFYPEFSPRFLKRYLDMYELVVEAVRHFIKEVREGIYPSEEHIYK